MKIFLIFILYISVNCLASSGNAEFDISTITVISGKGKGPSSKQACYIPNLSDEQIFIYNDIRKMHFSDTKEMRRILASQEKKYRKILNNPKIKTSGFAGEIAAKFFRTKYNLSKSQTAFFHAVLYKILLKGQRASLIDCL